MARIDKNSDEYIFGKILFSHFSELKNILKFEELENREIRYWMEQSEKVREELKTKNLYIVDESDIDGG